MGNFQVDLSAFFIVKTMVDAIDPVSIVWFIAFERKIAVLVDFLTAVVFLGDNIPLLAKSFLKSFLPAFFLHVSRRPHFCC